MKCKIRVIGLLALLLSIVTANAIAKEMPNVGWDGKWRFMLPKEKDNITITLDSVQYNRMMSFFNDTTVPYTKIDSILFSEMDSLRSILNEQENKVSQLISSIEEKKTVGGAPLWVVIVLAILTILFILLSVYVYIRQNKLRKRVISIVKNSQTIKEWLDMGYEKKKPLVTQKSYDREIGALQSENRDLKNRLAALEDALRTKETTVSTEPNQGQSARTPIAPRMLYADSIIDGVFSHVREQENEDTVFLLKLRNDNAASITIFKLAYSKVLANPSYLEGCEKQVIGHNSVEIIQEGEAEMTPNGKWRVVSPITVEIR